MDGYDEIKLVDCNHVEAEVREEMVAVRYVKDVEEEWIPVVKRRMKSNIIRVGIVVAG